jgi:divalent metal cation (Fe/Co/Zn/Cd) transporter
MFSLEVTVLETYEKLKESEKGAWVSIVAYIMLSVIKTAIGYWSGSKALTADGFNNATDIILSLAVLIGLKISRKPPDQDHTYGHFRAESISSLVASFIMITVALQVLVQAGQNLMAGTYETPDIWASWTALASAAVMYGVYSSVGCYGQLGGCGGCSRLPSGTAMAGPGSCPGGRRHDCQNGSGDFQDGRL